MKPLPQNYDHKEREKHWQAEWERLGVYRWRDDLPRDRTFVIDTPPPTVSGVLHMGHIFSYAQADFVARYQRMSGKDVFYPMGYDDNGLPTERLVEKTKKVRATDMSREDFIALCEGVSAEARQEFRKLFVSTALSVDWRQEYHTISEESRRISQLSFLDLFRKGQVYRKLQPMLWDPVDQTAIAQAEVEDKELASSFNDIKFRVASSELQEAETIVIGTTRPELIPACVAIFYHPDDARYHHLKGRHAVTPLFDVRVPILEDDTVEPEKGTGIMMCCTFGDEKDIEKWRKHDLPTRVVLNKYGKLDFSSLRGAIATKQSSENEDSGLLRSARNDVLEQLEKLTAAKAREKILELLKESGDLLESKPITHAVKCAERSGAPLEILPTHQWFVNVLEHKEALKAKGTECNWHPDWMRLRMNQWIDGLNWDWCISRQRYFGVPFPVWYLAPIENENAYLGSTQQGAHAFGKTFSDAIETITATPEFLPINPLDRDATREFFEYLGYNVVGLDALNTNFRENEGDIIDLIVEKNGKKFAVLAEADVMDTWATSSISPQLSSKGICHTERSEVSPATHKDSSASPQNDEFILDASRHAKLFPADLRPQAHEIIRTWAFYTVVKSYLHAESIPWKNLMISGWCLASDKTKMSKSKGNVITPVELIEEKGTDAVRYWASTSRLGTDTAFSEDLLKIGRKLVTKLWNASKFAALQLDKLEGTPTTAAADVARGKITEALDLWILTRLHRAITKATAEFEGYEYCDARVAAEDFFWNDFCDNYLELVKARAYGASSLRGAEGDAAIQQNETSGLLRSARNDEQQSALYTLHHCLNGILRLLAPIVPHITEELFSHIFDGQGSIHARGMWPKAAEYPCDVTAEWVGKEAVTILAAIRKRKSVVNLSIKYPLRYIRITNGFGLDDSRNMDDTSWKALQRIEFDLKSAANAHIIEWVEGQFDDTVANIYDGGRMRFAFEFADEADVA